MPKKAMEVLTESMFYVLTAFWKEELCGTDVAERVETQTDGRVRLGPATLYTILAKFEKEKLIREVEVVGRKRTYRITEKGRLACREELERLRLCLQDATALMEGGKTDAES